MTTGTGTGTGTGTETWLGTETGGGNGDDAGGKEREQLAASTATDEGKHVTGVAADEVKSVAAEAKDQVREKRLGGRRPWACRARSRTRPAAEGTAGGTLGHVLRDLGSMADNGSGLGGRRSPSAGHRARALSRAPPGP